MNFRILISVTFAAAIAVVGCGSDNGNGGGTGGTGGAGGSGGGMGGTGGGTGGSGGAQGVCQTGYGGFPAADCENLPDLTSYAVGDFYDVPETATDDCTTTFEGAANNSNELNTILDAANIGDVICIAAGTYEMEATITIAAVPNLTLKGVGASPDATVLNFGGPGTGKGILVQQDNVTIENMWVKNTGDNAVQQEEVTGSVFRKVHVSWDINENMSDNGAYGLYPTDCHATLVEYNQIQGASDAGIYVGKCGWGDDTTDGGIVRYNVVHENVLGLEVENSLDVVAHDNTMVNNAAGLLSLQQPISPEKPSNMNIVWYRNDSYCNNHPNFAATGVAQIAPPGSGAIIYSGNGQELCNNNIQGNITGGFLVISNYLVCQVDPPTDCNRPEGYIPYPINIYLHDNYYADNGTSPQGDFAALFLALGIGTTENPVENVFWDGYIYPDAPDGDPGICLGADNTASYRDMTNNQCQEVTGGDLLGVIMCAQDNTTTSTAGRLCDAPL
ncbi:MAG: parallel beta-helix domain-containing protein [Polyangiales bacterium]